MILLLSYDVRRHGGMERLGLQVLASLRRQGWSVRLLTPRRLGPWPLGRWLGRAWFLLGLLLWLPRCESVLSMHALLLRPLRWLDWLPQPPQRLCWLHGIEVWGAALATVQTDLNHCQRLIASSRFTRERVQERLRPNGPPIAVVHPMADLVDAASQPHPMPAGFVLLTVARMDAGERYKGHRLVLEALARLRQRRQLSDRLCWRVIGEGDDRPCLEARSRELGLQPWVRFLGKLSDGAVEQEFRRCSLLLMPSSYGIAADGRAMGEGFGIVYLEAAQAGRAAIACRQGGQTDLILDGDTGWLIDSDPDALADLLLRLADDRAMLQSAGERARQRARDRFSVGCFDRDLAAALTESSREAA